MRCGDFDEHRRIVATVRRAAPLRYSTPHTRPFTRPSHTPAPRSHRATSHCTFCSSTHRRYTSAGACLRVRARRRGCSSRSGRSEWCSCTSRCSSRCARPSSTRRARHRCCTPRPSSTETTRPPTCIAAAHYSTCGRAPASASHPHPLAEQTALGSTCTRGRYVPAVCLRRSAGGWASHRPRFDWWEARAPHPPLAMARFSGPLGLAKLGCGAHALCTPSARPQTR